MSITVIIATYNRADMLNKTLASFETLDLFGMDVEFVVVDNNSDDRTKDVVINHAKGLKVTYLFQPKPGKNSAINKALEDVVLGDIVVFTDDDIEPRPDWLQKVIEVSGRWPEYSVFGGKIIPLWPNRHVPGWVYNNNVLAWGFSAHDYSEEEVSYNNNEYPFGPNFWVRKAVFPAGRLFDESIGPRPSNRIMGSETSFLRELVRDGYRILYSPLAVVGHRIRAQQLKVSSILERAVWQGKSMLHFSGLPRLEFYNKRYYLWLGMRALSLVRWALVYISSYFHPFSTQRISLRIQGVRLVTFHLQAMKKALLEKRGKSTT